MTYNQIITLFSNIATAHKQIKSFGHGEAWEINSDDVFKDYILWVIPIDSTTNENTKVRTFTVLAFKKVKQDKSDETFILSDCEQILDDVIKIFINNSDNYELVNIPTLFPFKEEFGDWCAGWRADLQIQTDFANNYCDIPSNTFISPAAATNASYVLDSNGNIVATLNPQQTYTLQATYMDTAENYTVTGLTQTILQTPVFIYGVFLNGQRLTVTTDYTIVGTTITFNTALAADLVTIVYNY